MADDGAAPPHVTWDEETIALHDKERGTRMKIEEPKTPYHGYGSDQEGGSGNASDAVSPTRSLSGKEGHGMQWDELHGKLEKVKDDAKRSEWDSSDDEKRDNDGVVPSVQLAARDAEGKKLVKDPKFADKRKMHYNEFQAMKMWRQSHADDEDDEDDDEHGGEAGKAGVPSGL